MSRLEDLEVVREGLTRRMRSCSSDQNYAVLARTLLDVLAQIDQIRPPHREETPLDEFTQRLRDRRRPAASDPSGAAAN